MDTDRVEEWVAGYVKAWNSNDPDDIASLFSEDARYLTEPYAEPWEGHERIVEGWLDAKDEPGETTFEYDVLAVVDDLALVKGETTYKMPPRKYSNLWEIKVGPDGRATEFIEWWMKQE